MNTIEAVSKSEMFLSKRRLGWAGLAALVGCVGLCALPLLAAIGIGGGAVTAVAGFARPGTELIVGGLVFVGAFGVMAFRLRSRMLGGAASRCGGSCALSGNRDAPSTGSTHGGSGLKAGFARLFFRPPAADAPVVCIADLTQARVQIDGYRAAFAHLVGAEQFPGGFRWKFRAGQGLESQLVGLAEREAACCRFFGFEVTSDGAYIVWETVSTDGASSVRDEYFRLPERLREEPRPGRDLAVLKRMAADAGLAFIADVGPVNDVETRR